MSNPIDNPEAYDRIALDDDEIQLPCECIAGGDRERKIEQQQSPGFAGWYTVRKGEEPSDLAYRFFMWKVPRGDDPVDHFEIGRSLVASLRAADKQKIPKVYKITDLSVTHNEIKQVTLHKISRLIKVRVGLYAYEIGFKEYRKKRPMGGVAVPAKTSTDLEIERQQAEAERLDAELEALKKAAAEDGG